MFFRRGLVRSCTVGGSAAVAYGMQRPSASCQTSATEPLFSFGLIADIQYCDCDDAYNFAKTQLRAYRAALECVKNAVEKDWLAPSSRPLSFVPNLGAIIDQRNEAMGKSKEALETILAALRPLGAEETGEREPIPVYHLVGNHELYNLSRAEVSSLLNIPPPYYYSFRPAGVKGWRFLVLDAYDMTTIDNIEQTNRHEAAYAYLSEHNPNDLRGRGTTNWLAGLTGLERRFAPYNGAVGPAQLAWLRGELAAAARLGEKVIVSTHVPLGPGSCVDTTLLWNYDEVLAVIHSEEAGGCVAAVLAGHDHTGGYCRDAGGTHHLTMPSPLNTAAGDRRAHACVEVYEDRIEVRGRGLVPSRTLALAAAPPLPRTAEPGAAAAGTASRL